MTYLISGVETGAVTFPVETFGAAVHAHWGPTVSSVLPDGDGQIVASIRPAGAPGFAVRLDGRGRFLSSDGTPDQVADVAVWALTLLPRDHEQVVLYDGNGSRELRDGMSPAEVWSAWSDF